MSQYDGDPKSGVRLPLSATQFSQINAGFVYRDSTVEPSNRITLPASTKDPRPWTPSSRTVSQQPSTDNSLPTSPESMSTWTGSYWPNSRQSAVVPCQGLSNYWSKLCTSSGERYGQPEPAGLRPHLPDVPLRIDHQRQSRK